MHSKSINKNEKGMIREEMANKEIILDSPFAVEGGDTF